VRRALAEIPAIETSTIAVSLAEPDTHGYLCPEHRTVLHRGHWPCDDGCDTRFGSKKLVRRAGREGGHPGSDQGRSRGRGWTELKWVMGILSGHSLLGAVLLAGVSVSWTRFHSSLYPYHISQPSSFKHVILTNTAHQRVDYFFPSVGSFPTNVNIVATPGRKVRDGGACLKKREGYHVHRVGWLRIMGRLEPLVRSDVDGLAGKYSVEQVCFVRKGTVWQLNASYETRFRAMRTTMLRMLASFRTDS
jgi:hypothetical protein